MSEKVPLHKNNNKDEHNIKNLLKGEDNTEYIAKVVSGFSEPGGYSSPIVGYSKKKLPFIAMCAAIFLGLSVLTLGVEYLVNKQESLVSKFLLSSEEKSEIDEAQGNNPALKESENITLAESKVELPEVVPISKKADVVDKKSDLIFQLKKENELLSKELVNAKKYSFLLENSKQQSEKLKKERDRLKKKVASLNKLVATIKARKPPAPNPLPNSVDLKNIPTEKIELMTQLAEMKKNLIAMEEREKRRPELNNELKEYKKNLESVQSEKEFIALEVEELNKRIDIFNADKLDAEDLKKQLDITRDKLFSMKSKSAQSAMSYHYNLGVIYTKNRMYQEALVEYKKALSMKNDDIDINYNLAILYDDHLHNHKKAVEHYKKYLELDPDSSEVAQVSQWLKEAEKYLE